MTAIRKRPWGFEVVLVFDGATGYVACKMLQQVKALAHAETLIAQYRINCPDDTGRIRRCREALARCGHELGTALLARHLAHYERRLESSTDWTAGNEQDGFPA